MDSKGKAVHPVHKSWDMVVNIMIGIRLAIGRVMVEANRDLCPADYTMKEKLTIVLPHTPVGKAPTDDVRFVDYAPMVFRKLRELWGVPADEYMSSIGPQQILRSDWRGDTRGREHYHGNIIDADGTLFRGKIGFVFLLLVRWEVHGEDDFPHRTSLLPAHP